MCSVEDGDVEEVNFMTNETSSTFDIDNKNCFKCNKQKPSVVLRKKDAYCKECFLASTVHKFRASLGKARLIRPGDKILLGFSGDAASCALLNLVKSGLAETTHKKLRFEPHLLFIDDGIVTHGGKDAFDRRNDVQQMITDQGLPAYYTSISDVLKAEPNFIQLGEGFKVDVELDNQMTNLFASVLTLTAKQDLLKKLRRKLLLNCAMSLNCSYILVADTATKLAANLLSSVSLGGGSHLSSDVSFCDSRDDKIKILRPMRDFMLDDLKYFIDLNNIKYLPHQSMAKNDNPYASIQTLTNKFVNDLQENFPGTISTVLRTGEKMENRTINLVSDEDTCALCLSQLDTQEVVCSALQATNYSRMISNKVTTSEQNLVSNSVQNCSDCTCKTTDSKPLTRSELEAFLCYSCRLVIKDVKQIELLPQKLVSSVRSKKTLLETRSQIQDFLL